MGGANTLSQQTSPQSRPVALTAINDTQPYRFDQNHNPILAFGPSNHHTARNYTRRVTNCPQISPSEDPTISKVLSNREFYIAEMVRAVWNLQDVNDKSEHRFVKTVFNLNHRDCASGYEVEAACRVLFDTVMDRCINGYRGPLQKNRVMNSRRSGVYQADRVGSCEQRLVNVIVALRYWKNVCHDILYEDCNRVNLAHAPLCYAATKQENRRNNDKKGQTTEELRGNAERLANRGVDGQLLNPPSQGMVMNDGPMQISEPGHDSNLDFAQPLANTSQEYMEYGDYMIPRHRDLGSIAASVNRSNHPNLLNQPTFRSGHDAIPAAQNFLQRQTLDPNPGMMTSQAHPIHPPSTPTAPPFHPNFNQPANESDFATTAAVTTHSIIGGDSQNFQYDVYGWSDEQNSNNIPLDLTSLASVAENNAMGGGGGGGTVDHGQYSEHVVGLTPSITAIHSCVNGFRSLK